jgi:hypothetical protein
MLDQWLTQLQHSDPAKRREAILALGKLADARALPHLAQLYKTESDPTLRELAAKAGKHIQQSAAQRKRRTDELPHVPPFVLDDSLLTTPPDPTPPAFPEPPPYTPPAPATPPRYTPPPPDALPDPDEFDRLTPAAAAAKPAAQAESAPPPDKPISERDRQRAKSLLQSAYNYQTSGDSANALVTLAKALRLDPDLAGQSSAVGLASALVGGSGRESIGLVLARAERADLKQTQAPVVDSDLIDALIAAAVLFVVIVFFSVALVYGIVVFVFQANAVLLSTTISAADLQRELANFTLQTLLPEALRNTSVTLLTTIINLMIVYWVGTTMGGVGSVVRYLKVILSLYIAFYLLLLAGFGLIIFGALSGSQSTLETLLPLGAYTLIGSVLLFIVGQIYLTMRVQEFGLGNAIASVFVGGAVAGFVLNIMGLFGVR